MPYAGAEFALSIIGCAPARPRPTRCRRLEHLIGNGAPVLLLPMGDCRILVGTYEKTIERMQGGRTR
jgi:hypothetical protein